MTLYRHSAFASAAVACIVGMAVVLPLFVQAGDALGATGQQTASFIIGSCLAMAVTSIFLSVQTRMPVVCATSTSALAMVSQSTGYSLPEAVGAFVVVGLLLIATGVFKPVSRVVAGIPAGIGAGMLAGVLLPFVLAVPNVLIADPVMLGVLTAVFFLLRLWNPALALVATLVIGIGVFLVFVPDPVSLSLQPPALEFVTPVFSLAAMIGLAIPLYLVTMASQNLPGLAVLRADGYEPNAEKLIGFTGLLSLLTAFAGTIATALAAITAALCTGPDAHPDKDKRWITGVCYGGIYLVFAVFGVTLTSLFLALPASFIALIVGLGLLSPLINATMIALKEDDERLAAMITLAVTASGVAIAGIGAAFWGLLAGLIIQQLSRIKKQ